MHMMESDRLCAVMAYRKRVRRLKMVKTVVYALFLYTIMLLVLIIISVCALKCIR